MRLFFQGTLTGVWTSGWQRCESLLGLGHDVVRFCQARALQQASPGRLRTLVGCTRFDMRVVEAFNRQWLKALVDCRPDVAWLEWPKLLLAETILQARARLPRCRFIAFFDDNPFGERTAELWQWTHFLEAVPVFDLHLVKRSSDVPHLAQFGARRVELFMHGCYEQLFHPREGGPGFCHPVSFVGTALDHRVGFVRRLVVGERLPLHVFGNRWERHLFYHTHRENFHPPALGQDYVDVLRRSQVSLAFVSSSNRDEYTMRSFEIPACMGFMLAERTPTHQSLFLEGEEAEFFGSVEECGDKARFYVRQKAARDRVARAGYMRCQRDDYSLRRRLKDALKHIADTVDPVAGYRSGLKSLGCSEAHS